jgi:enediyne polyketide synthase
MNQGIAIVGMACQFPDADSPARLWENVLAGRRAFRIIPDERVRLEDYWSADPAAPDRFYSRHASLIEGYEFDRIRYRVPGTTYRTTDMTHWLALDTAAGALADAGFPDGEGLPRARTAVIVGNTLTGEFTRANLMRLRWPYVRRTVGAALRDLDWDAGAIDGFLAGLEPRYKSAFPPVDEDTLAGGLSNTIAGRICGHFGLNGGGFTIDGACSSALLSVATACTALSSRQVDAAVVGGVDLSIDPFELTGFAKAGALARDDMRVYDRDSQGFWPGEGCGMLVLLRREDADARGLRSYATIHGWGYSSDGTGAITRPEADGQLLAVERAYQVAGFDVGTVGYFEGHGTGTAVGDATELRVLARARRAARADAPPAAIGTIKGNLGHTKAAAGIAGLIKASLAVHHQVIPPVTGNVHPHPELASSAAALRLPRTAEPWPDGHPVRAGVSAMGFGGINVHVAIQGAATARRTGLDARSEQLAGSWQDCELLLLDAASMTGLRRQVAHLAEMTRRLSLAELGDLAATLHSGLRGDPVRAAVVAGSPEQAADRLGELLTAIDGGSRGAIEAARGFFLGHQGPVPAGPQPSAARIGYLFPGQGSGTRDQGKALSRRFGQVRDLYQDAVPAAGSDFVATAAAQPRIVASSLAGLRVLADLGIAADMAVGHSLGELTALHWAGAIGEPELLELVRARGKLMGELGDPGGAMASVTATAGAVAELLAAEPVVIAGYNGPGQTVIAGPSDAVDRACQAAARRGLAATRVPVSHAFHSPGMSRAAQAFAAHLEGLTFRPLRRTIFSTVTGQALGDGTDLQRLLARQLLEPVKFAHGVARMADADLLVEVGPGRVLSALAGSILAEAARAGGGRPPAVIALEADGNSLRGLLSIVGAAYALGVPVRHDRLFRDRLTRPLPLDKEFRFLASPCESAPDWPAGPAVAGQDLAAKPPAAPGQPSAPVAPADPATTLGLLCALAAQRAELPPEAVSADTFPLDDLHLSSITVGEIMSRVARERGLPAPVVTSGYATSTLAQLAEAIEELAQTQLPGDGPAGREPAGVAPWVRAFSVELAERAVPDSASPAAGVPGEWRVLATPGHPLADALPAALRGRGLGDGVLLCLPHDGGPQHVGLMLAAARAALERGSEGRLVVVQDRRGAAGLAKSLHLEAPGVATTVITLPVPAAMTADTVRAAVTTIAADVAATTGFSEVHYDAAGRRRVPVLRLATRLGDGPLPLSARDVLLATGGGKGVTAECALALARESGAALAVVGRADPATDAELAANLSRLEAAGVTFGYFRADVTSADDMRAAVRRAQQQLGQVTALLHGAGRNQPVAVRDLTEEHFLATLAPKAGGLAATLAALDPSALRLLVTFGSIIGRAGLRGQADYATANDWLTEMTRDFQREHPACRCLAVEWSVWSGVGMGERLGVLESLIREGVSPISVDDGIAILRQLLASPTPPALVVMGRAAGLSTMTLESRELPLTRFADRLLVDYPGIEVVAEAELTIGSDPYLGDHVLDGDMLVPAVVGIEAMAQAAAAVGLAGGEMAVANVEFPRPIGVPVDGSQVIQVAALRSGDRVAAVIRTASTGFHIDHFRAEFRVPASTLDDPQRPGPAPEAGRVPLDPSADLYGQLLFQGKRFQHLAGYRQLSATSCVAELSAATGGSWFAAYLPGTLLLGDPGVRDAFMHAIQCCVPDATLLPVAVKRIDPVWSGCGGRQAELFATQRDRDGDTFTYDIEVRAPDGQLLERWQGLRLHAVRWKDAAGPWSPALLGPYLERCLGGLLPGAPRCVVEPDAVPGRGGQAARREQTSVAMSRMLGRPVEVVYRADGRPEVAGQDVRISASHGAGVTFAVAGDSRLACDVQAASGHADGDWPMPLDAELIALGKVIQDAAGEEPAVSATRVWGAVECVRKVGRALPWPLVLADARPAGWVLLRSGQASIATFATRLRGQPQPVVFAVLAEDSANGSLLRIPLRGWLRGHQPRGQRLLRQLRTLAGPVPGDVPVRARSRGAPRAARRPEAVHDQGRVRLLRRALRLRRGVDQDAAVRADPDSARVHLRLRPGPRGWGSPRRPGRSAGRLHAGIQRAGHAGPGAGGAAGRA